MNIRKDILEHDKNTREDMDKRWEIVKKKREERLYKIELKRCQEENGRCPSQPKDKLIQIAKDIHGNLIFTDRHCHPKDIMSTFMIFALMDPKKMYIPDSIGMIYEYMSQAGPMSVNGNPTFFSARLINKEDTVFIWNKVKQIEQMMSSLEE